MRITNDLCKISQMILPASVVSYRTLPALQHDPVALKWGLLNGLLSLGKWTSPIPNCMCLIDGALSSLRLSVSSVRVLRCWTSEQLDPC